jgi:hypothetical protein
MASNLPTIAQVRKALVNIAGLATSLIMLGFVHGQALVITNSVIAVLVVIAHYQIVNAPMDDDAVNGLEPLPPLPQI